jgi:3-hydroxyisobutyrate dehydrogenase-like beta-hydroxyacid dehydrogenase
MKIAFIGLGHMGAPMALNLLNAGHELVVFDVVKARPARSPPLRPRTVQPGASG